MYYIYFDEVEKHAYSVSRRFESLRRGTQKLSGAAPGCIPECIWPSLIIMRQLRGTEPTSLDEIEERGNALQKMSSGVCEYNDLYVKSSSQT